MKHTCLHCHTEFESDKKKQCFCSKECGWMYKRRWRFHRDEMIAARMGITIEELKKRRKKGEFSSAKKRRDAKKLPRRPKTYAQIKAANRARKVEAGWRGQVVLGGGGCHSIHNDSPLTSREMEYRPGYKGGGLRQGRHNSDYNHRYYLRRKAGQE